MRKRSPSFLDKLLHSELSEDRAEAQALIVATEYTALRDEIGRYQEHQRQLINAVFIIVGGTITLAGGQFGTEALPPLASASTLLLFVPPLYSMLALLYSDRAIRIIRLASYLHHHVRPLASEVAGMKVWEWETYKSTTTVVSRRVAFMLDKLRWSVFIVPLLSTSILTTISGDPGDAVYRQIALIVGSASLLVALFAALLTEETHGTVRPSRVRRRGR